MLDLHKAQYADLRRLFLEGRQTFLLVGDAGVGKKTLVQRVLSEVASDALITIYPSLAIGDVRSIRQQVLRKAMSLRIFSIDGDDASIQAYNAMLKILEEPPPGVVFIITASKPPIQTVVSRCTYLMVPPLTGDELKSVLAFKGMSERAIASIASQAYGSVTGAMRVYEKFEEKRRLVPFLKALKERDLNFVMGQVKTIRREDISLLVELSDDVLMSRYGLLNPEFSAMVPVTSDFIMIVKDSLLAGAIPSLNWLRAWFATA